jgi:hypothetical protein
MNHINQKHRDDDNVNHFFYPPPDGTKLSPNQSYGLDSGPSTADLSSQGTSHQHHLSHMGQTTEASHLHTNMHTYGNNRVAPL